MTGLVPEQGFQMLLQENAMRISAGHIDAACGDPIMSALMMCLTAVR